MKIYLSPSCQINNIYATGNTNEQEQCHKIAECAKQALERCGFEVKKAQTGKSTTEKIIESNNWAADLHIPIHTNAFNGNITGGTLVMIYNNDTENKKAGDAILKAVSPISPGQDYSLRTNPYLAELNSTKAIAVYIECEYHDTEEGSKWIINNVKSLGEAICKGVCDYANVTYIQSSANNTEDNLYRVQVGAFKDINNAKKLQEELESKGYTTIIKK